MSPDREPLDREPATERTTSEAMAGRTPAPWVRTRLRTSRAAALLLALLVLGSTFLAAALPRTLDRDSDRALTKQLSDTTPHARSLTATLSSGTTDTTGRPAYSQQVLDQVAQQLRGDLTAPLAPSPAEDSYGANSGTRYLTDPRMPRPGVGLDPVLSLFTLHDQYSHLRLVAGRLPDGHSFDADGNGHFDVALTKPVADRLGVGVGAALNTSELTPFARSRPHPPEPSVQAVVVGIFEPTDANQAIWSTAGCLTNPCLEATGTPPESYWDADALVAPEDLTALPQWHGAKLFWQIPIDPHHLHGYQLGQAQRVIGSALDGPQAAALGNSINVPSLRPASMLPDAFTKALNQQAAAAPLHAIGPIGAGAVAAVVLLLAAGLAVDRRRAELVLLRARGASLTAIGWRLFAETAVLTVPATVLGTALALTVLPTPRWTAAVLTGLLTGLVALLPFPLRAVLTLRGARRRKGSGAAGATRKARTGRFARRLGSPSRLVAELATLALATAAVLAVRRRGVAPPGTSLDLLLTAAPLLLAVAGAVVLARLFPLLLAPGVRWAARQPGAIGFLGLARATRNGAASGAHGPATAGGGSQAPTVLPLMALLLAVTTAGFGVTVLSSTDTARQLAARQSIGGDARVLANSSGALPVSFPAAVAKLPGMRAGTLAVIDNDTPVGAGDSGMVAGAILVMVDPQSYAELARQVGYGQFDPALLKTPTDAGAPVPALTNVPYAGRLGTQGNDLQLPDAYGTLRIQVVGTVDGTPAVPVLGERPLLVVSSAAVAHQHPAAAPLAAAPTAWFGTGDGITTAALRGLLGQELGAGAEAGAGAGAGTGTDAAAQVDARFNIATRDDFAHGLGDDPLQHSAEQLFWAAVVAAVGFSVLSLLLTLLRAAPERAALLARLRTMGLRRRQGLVLIMVEALPQALVAAVAGAAVACLAVPLLGSSINLSAMVGASVPSGLHLALGQVAWQALILAGLSTAAVVAETLVAGRRQINTELRAGDQR
ncbi:FtsX-like permease family protein [Kitasatospora kifunensis]|uniref:Putative ABC transport system permease protein n=1 Tax=Kitasatospora kifunensis TaxID=58351 RepID=A0A7W7R5E3_KITKI|nr:FtsX-like permease family protein [Kitasatospora kifunensis]MBB4925742.1 putative ABC transport system permease protein [Kitasatospora kifunensis]